MQRFAFLAALIVPLTFSAVGCTNTVRGLGADFNSQHLQDYNDRTASDLDRY